MAFLPHTGAFDLSPIIKTLHALMLYTHKEGFKLLQYLLTKVKRELTMKPCCEGSMQ